MYLYDYNTNILNSTLIPSIIFQYVILIVNKPVYIFLNYCHNNSGQVSFLTCVRVVESFFNEIKI